MSEKDTKENAMTRRQKQLVKRRRWEKALNIIEEASAYALVAFMFLYLFYRWMFVGH